MSAVEKFDFGHSFDADAGESTREKRKSKLEVQTEEAFQKGRTAGLAEARSGLEQQSTTAIQAICQSFAALDQTRIAVEETMSRQAIGVATALVGKALPALARREAIAEIETVIAECIGKVLDEPRLVVRVTESLMDTLREPIEAAAKQSGFSGKIIVLAEHGLGASDCRVEWADGGAERNLDTIWQEIEATIQHTLSIPPNEQSNAAPNGSVATSNNEQ